MTRSIDPMMDFFLREKGELIQINGVQQTALIRDVVDKIQAADEKIVRAATALHTGDFIDYRDERYLLTSEIDKNDYSYRGRMRKCNYSIAFNWKGNVKWLDAIVEGKTFSIDVGTVISMPEGNIHVYVQDNADTRDIGLNQRFYNTHQPFKVMGIDQTVTGIIKLNCALGMISTAYDDVESNVADRWTYEIAHSYTLNIDNGTIANVLINDILQLYVTTTDNGSSVPNSAITYTSSDPSVVSVDNQGKVMGIEAGQAIITAKLTYHTSIIDTIQITAVETLMHNYTISISGNPTIIMNQSTSYVSRIYDNGTEIFDQFVQWSLRNQDNSTPIMGSVIATTGNSATVKAGSTTGNIVLSAEFGNNPMITMEKTIQIKGLW